MANLCTSVLFGIRNVDKATSGDNIARTPVAVGQSANAVKAAAEYNSGIAKGLKNFHASTPFLKGCQKTVNFLSKNINPLICAAGVYKVVTADDKKSEAIHQTGALGTMFVAEKAYKALADTKQVKNTISNIKNLNCFKNLKNNIGDKKFKLLSNILYGLGFVATSITGYNIGEKIAKKISGKEEVEKAQKQLAMMQRCMPPQQMARAVA